VDAARRRGVVSVGWVDGCDCVCWVDFWEARRRVSVAFVCREERIVAAWSLRWDLREVICAWREEISSSSCEPIASEAEVSSVEGSMIIDVLNQRSR